ncbi:hypothetical protein B0J14DRAFT_690910 [Halenospora varia]|nr:hypothetical protein B0J14DRAFT_690910 [Halenospora varia]
MEHEPPSTSILLNHMMQNNWCIHQARSLCQRFTFVVVYYLATFPPVAHDRGHGECIERSQCVANNTNPKDYKNRHVTHECECEFLSPNNEEVKKIIKRGGIPLLQMSKVSDHQIQLRVIRANYSTKYTAISHVWSDGLGNPDANALPTCQVRRIMQQVRDGDLENLTSPRSIFKKKDGKQPYWTRALMECHLYQKKRKFGHCKKGHLPPISGFRCQREFHAHYPSLGKKNTFLSNCMKRINYQPSGVGHPTREGLGGNANFTTMMDDIHGIFATLLDFHTEEILLLDRKERMKAILCAQESLPIRLLYNRNARRSTLGSLDRWVPDVPAGCVIQKTDA